MDGWVGGRWVGWWGMCGLVVDEGFGIGWLGWWKMGRLVYTFLKRHNSRIAKI